MSAFWTKKILEQMAGTGLDTRDKPNAKLNELKMMNSSQCIYTISHKTYYIKTRRIYHTDAVWSEIMRMIMITAVFIPILPHNQAKRNKNRANGITVD